MASRSVAIQDKNAPTLPGAVQRAQAVRFVEAGADSYVKDFFIPAYAVLDDIIVYAEALWDAASSASLEIGDFTTAATPVEIDADGFYTAIDLKATDLTAGQSLAFAFPGAAADAGAYLDGTATHILARMSTSDRYVRAKIVSVGAGTAGRTVVVIQYSAPELEEVTYTA